MATTPAIHLRVHDVGGNFVRLTQALDHSPQYAGQVGSHSVEDEFDRFKIWAGNIAAHRKGRRSLEYRLRDATHLRDEVNGLLTTLEQSLKDAVAIVKGEKTPWDALEDSDDDSDSASDASSDGGEETELKQLLDSIQSSVTCLFRLSMAIRDPASDDRLQRTITVDKSYFEDYDILHAKTKFPDCAEFLSQRLGRAISGRRQYLSYRELHHQKLAKKAELIGLEQPRTEHTSNSTEASPLPVARSNSLNVLDEDDTLSQTSYATSVNATIRVPPLPKQAREHEHFECPLCFMIVSIHTKAAWKQHIYRDLHPYSCTIEQCAMEDHLYESRNAWFQHELEAHRSSWQCVPGCDTLHTRECDFEAHVSKQHPDLASPSMLIALKRTSRRAADTTAKTNCPLCGVLMSVKALKRHVGRHQEQLALFALPPNLEETDGDVEGDDANSYDATLNVNEWQEEDMSDSDDSESVDASSIAEPPDPVQPEMMLCLVWIGKHRPYESSLDKNRPEARKNPQALEEAREQFEEREDCCIVLRVLTREEIRKLADRTKEIRQAREAGDTTGNLLDLQHDNEENVTQMSNLSQDATPKDPVPDPRDTTFTFKRLMKHLAVAKLGADFRDGELDRVSSSTIVDATGNNQDHVADDSSEMHRTASDNVSEDDAILHDVPMRISSTQARQQRRQNPPCDACQDRGIECDATTTKACSACWSRAQTCQFTKAEPRSMWSEEDRDYHEVGLVEAPTAANPASDIKARKRTKTGCLTCRKRKIRCGEERPTCRNCVKSKRPCEGYNQRLYFKPSIIDWPDDRVTVTNLREDNLMVPASSSSTENEREMGKASEEPESELEPEPVDVDVDLQVPEGSQRKITRRSVEDFEGLSRDQQKPLIKATEFGDEGFSQTDYAAMYRETEWAWRRPQANSIERDARPSSMLPERGPRSSTRELGPPPSTRGFDKINGIAATIEPGRSEARASIRVPSPEYMTSIGNSQISQQQFGEPQAVAVMPISPSQASMPPPPDPQVNEERSKLEMPLFTKEEIEQKQAEDAKFTRLEQLLGIQQQMRIEKQAAKGKMEQKQAGGAYLARLEQMLNEVQQSGVKNEAAEGKMELQVEDAKFARLEHLLIEQMQERIKKEAAKLKATEEATAAAAAAKLKGDEDKLEKLEKLILAQKEEQLKREEAVELTRKADEADEKVAKSLEAKKAKGNMEESEELEKPILATEEQPKRREAEDASYKSTRSGRKIVRAMAGIQEPEDTLFNHEKALKEAKKAQEELGWAMKAVGEAATAQPSDAPKTSDQIQGSIIDSRYEHGEAVSPTAETPHSQQQRDAIRLRHSHIVVAKQVGGPEVFCICRKSERGIMVECGSCHEWYHAECIGMTRARLKELETYTCAKCFSKHFRQVSETDPRAAKTPMEQLQTDQALAAIEEAGERKSKFA